MNKFASFAFFCVALWCASAYEMVQDAEGQEFYLVPVSHRQRRQANLPIYNNGKHQVGGSAFYNKQKPVSYGGQVNYHHIPSGSNLNVQAQHTKKFGTDLGVQGNYNLWQKGNSRLDAQGHYNRHYGGVQGAGRPDAYGGLNFKHKF